MTGPGRGAGTMGFFVGLHVVAHAGRLMLPCMISVNRLRDRVADFDAGDWVMDSGAFTSVALRGGYDHAPADYAAQVRRWAGCGRLRWAAAQDYMCEPFVLARTGLTVADHQRLTIERYDEILGRDTAGVPILPVLQGYWPDEYARHADAYGDRLRPGMPVGVGSVCKRNASVHEVGAVLRAIHRARPGLLLHGFGLKRTALAAGDVRSQLASADSMAWSYSARMQGRDGNSAVEAERFWREVQSWAEPALELWAA